MKTSAAFALAAAKLIAAHTTFQSFEGEEHHYAVQTPSNGKNPIYDVTSDAMICNGGSAISGEFVSVKAGSSIGLQWHHNDGASTEGDADEPIASSHKGPVMVYIAKAEGNGVGPVWTKIYEDGLTNGVWGVDNFISSGGLITVDIPDLVDGNYLIRPEMIGLHEASRDQGAQFYNGCGQIKVTGGSTELPSSGTDMTKAYSASDPGVLFDIYNNPTSYKIPGPAVWDGASSGSAPSTPTTPSKPSTSSTPTTPSASATSSAPPTPVEEADGSETSAPAPTPSSGSGSSPPSSGSGPGTLPGLPKKFTMKQFITWLKNLSAGSMVRRHARAFDV